MKDLAPTIHRQRLVIEGYPREPIKSADIKLYLSELSRVIGMRQLNEPVTHRSEKFGWAGWMHWETSGAHFYAWDDPILFYSVDIYTCKEFKPEAAIEFTKNFFKSDHIEYKEF